MRRTEFLGVSLITVEYAEKLPSPELVTELKAADIHVAQQCTDESWKHLEAVGKQRRKIPETEIPTMS